MILLETTRIKLAIRSFEHCVMIIEQNLHILLFFSLPDSSLTTKAESIKKKTTRTDKNIGNEEKEKERGRREKSRERERSELERQHQQAITKDINDSFFSSHSLSGRKRKKKTHSNYIESNDSA